MDDKLTPREYAHDCAISALYQRYNNLPSATGADKRLRNAVAKLHNKLVDASGMDGTHIADNL